MHSFAALADPTRRRIVELLSAGELSAGEIGAAFEVSAPAISQHLKVLREAELVTMRIDAQRRIYRLDAEGFTAMETWLSQVQQFWGDRLDTLERELRKPAPKPSKGRKRK